MSKSAILSDDAYAALQAAKVKPEESLSAVILRHVAPPIRTFGDLERHLENPEAPPLKVDYAALKRLRRRKARGH